MPISNLGKGLTAFIDFIETLIDVVITNPINNDVLTYQNGNWVNQAISSGVATIDTEKNILALTPTANKIAWASDLRQLFFADGTNWWVLSAYLDKNLQNPDEGYIQGSNREGYGSLYITDKSINHCSIGANATTVTGGIRYNSTGLNSNPVLQTYYGAVWNNIVAGFNFQEISAVLEHTPVGFTQRIAVFSGNSDLLGLNGISMIQGYKVSMGAYPVAPQINGGTF